MKGVKHEQDKALVSNAPFSLAIVLRLTSEVPFSLPKQMFAPTAQHQLALKTLVEV